MDYKKKYEQALAKAQELIINENGMVRVDRTLLEDIFPELKESEDERIRKWIIGVLSTYEHDRDLRNAAIAWLEKQGEHANFCSKIQVGDKVTRNEDGVLVNLSQLKRVAKKDEKQGEQKPNCNNKELKDVVIAELSKYNSNDLNAPWATDSTGLQYPLYFANLGAKWQGEQKSADKVELKFKAGDKIISTISNIPYYITEVCNGHYLTDVGCIIMFNAQDNFELGIKAQKGEKA